MTVSDSFATASAVQFTAFVASFVAVPPMIVVDRAAFTFPAARVVAPIFVVRGATQYARIGGRVQYPSCHTSPTVSYH